jgi:hypothetical protein
VTERDDAGATGLRTALHQALSVRDRRTSAPSFEALTVRDWGVARPLAWRPALAMVASTLVVVAAVLLWRGTDNPQAPVLDARLVEELSPSSYWSVPTDELLAYAPAPVNLDIAIDTGLPVSLEESLL